MKLRRAGVNVSPALEGAIRIGDRNLSRHRRRAAHPAAPRAGWRVCASGRMSRNSSAAPSRAVIAPETLRRLGLAQGARPVTERGQQLPPLASLAEAPPGAIIVDIGVAQRLLDRPKQLSRLIIADDEPLNAERLTQLAGDALRLVEPDDEGDLARLTDSFHLNLTAFGLLAFIVGFFIVHASFGLAFEQRLPTVRTLRALGVSAGTLIAAMLCELALVTLIAGGGGVIGGYLIARALLPDVAASLEGLYGAQISESLALDARWWLSGLAMAGGGALLAAASGLTKTLRLPVLSVALPIAWRDAHHRYLRRQGRLRRWRSSPPPPPTAWETGLSPASPSSASRCSPERFCCRLCWPAS